MSEPPSCAVIDCPDRGWPRLMDDPNVGRRVGIAVCKRHQNAIDVQGATYSFDDQRRLLVANEPKPRPWLVVDQAEATYGPHKMVEGRAMRVKIRGWSMEPGGVEDVVLVLDDEAAEQLHGYVGEFLRQGDNAMNTDS